MMKYFEGLTGAVELPREIGPEELGAVAGRAVHDQDGVAHHALRIPLGPAQRAVVQSQLRQPFTRREDKITGDVFAFGHDRKFSRANPCEGQKEKEKMTEIHDGCRP